MPNIASSKRSARALIWAILAAWLLAGPGSAPRAGFATGVRGSVGQTAQTPNGPTAETSGNRLRELPVLKPALSGTLYENVVTVLERRYYDERFRKDVLPGLASKHSDPSKRAGTLLEERQAVHDLLSEIPATHLGLLSKRQFGNIAKDLNDQPYPTFGLQLVEVEGKQYAFMVLENGPAARAGVLPWDRIVSIDDVPAEKSSKLDWRTDDAYLADDRDPPVRPLIANEGEQIKLKIERKRGKFSDVTVRAESYSSFDAAKASARTMPIGERTAGYIHFWFVHLSGVPELLKQKLEGEFSQCSVLILDLRGRGGGGGEIQKIISVLGGKDASWHKPIVALVDRQSRSAKEVLAYELKRTGIARIVGEKTAGAVIPATFADVGHDTILMFPSFKLPKYTDLLELKPVEPDVSVERAGPYSAGKDPILAGGLEEATRLAKTTPQRVAAVVQR